MNPTCGRRAQSGRPLLSPATRSRCRLFEEFQRLARHLYGPAVQTLPEIRGLPGVAERMQGLRVIEVPDPDLLVFREFVALGDRNGQRRILPSAETRSKIPSRYALAPGKCGLHAIQEPGRTGAATDPLPARAEPRNLSYYFRIGVSPPSHLEAPALRSSAL